MGKRISFHEFDAAHLYELACEHFQEDCFGCDNIKKRLERFVGAKEIKEIRAIIRKNGYCNKLAPKSPPPTMK